MASCPLGLQIVGHRGHDNEVIEAAIEIEAQRRIKQSQGRQR
jgi:Asp-tRNA(Asn)/Glu-tRNA(Gln) amidotransferase A subunit family amidase